MYVRKSLTDQHFNSSRQETNKSTQHLHVGADSLNPSLAVFVPFDQALSVSSQGSQPHACCDTLSKPRMGHVGQNTYCSGSAQGPRKAIGISTVNLHYWLPVSLLLWKPIIGNCHTTEQFMEVFRLCMPQWELPLTAVFHQPRSAYLFTQWDKSIRNLNKSSLKRPTPEVLQKIHFLACPSSWLHSVNCWTVLSLFLFIFYRNILALVLCSTAPLRIWKSKRSCFGLSAFHYARLSPIRRACQN